MLTELRIADLGVIGDVTLLLEPGLNVLTGETGAGKTMVVSALELLLGGRADVDTIRGGSAAAVVEGRLRPLPPGAGAWVSEGDDELIVSREVGADAGGARSRARVAGRLAPVSALAEVMAGAVEVHGQSESVRLSAPGVQRDLLDRSGGAALTTARAAYGLAYSAWRSAEDELSALAADTRDGARELDRLRFELAEIDAVSPEPGEEERLDADLGRLEHAEALTGAASAAAEAVVADGGGRDALGSAVAALRDAAGFDPALDTLRARAEGLAAETQDLGLELVAYAEGIEADPRRLDELRDRRGALAGLARKYGPDAAAIFVYADEARSRAAVLEGGEDRAIALQTEVAGLRVAVDEAAADLRTARSAASEELSAQVEGHLAELSMSGARMEATLEPIEPGPHGADRVSFRLAANPGEPLLPLAKAASGGERSRVALAVRLALADADDTSVLVFDEVDAGIGGGVALEVGRKLARLAQGRQVLCVTHLAQLAAFADAHFAVSKASQAEGRVVAGVERLDEAGRVTELSRMLSGSPDSELAAGHAAELRAAALATRQI